MSPFIYYSNLIFMNMSTGMSRQDMVREVQDRAMKWMEQEIRKSRLVPPPSRPPPLDMLSRTEPVKLLSKDESDVMAMRSLSLSENKQ